MTKIQVISEENQRFGGLNFIVDSRTKCNREEERGEKLERGDVVMYLPGSVVE